uniref:RIKEN cDNA 9230112D13 gene n=1 Tax=Mus spicilegus TaxID=10103 RepID=A0A8C6IDR4_MUSSI
MQLKGYLRIRIVSSSLDLGSRIHHLINFIKGPDYGMLDWSLQTHRSWRTPRKRQTRGLWRKQLMVLERNPQLAFPDGPISNKHYCSASGREADILLMRGWDSEIASCRVSKDKTTLMSKIQLFLVITHLMVYTTAKS